MLREYTETRDSPGSSTFGSAPSDETNVVRTGDAASEALF